MKKQKFNLNQKPTAGFTRIVDFGIVPTKVGTGKSPMPKFTTGFTLVEALVAISILSLSVVGAFGVAQGGLQSSFFARDQMTAYYLAQEAVEMVKNKRHTDILNGDHWLNGLVEGQGGPCTGSSYCRVDASVSSSNFTNCSGFNANCSKLYLDASNGFYTHEPDSGSNAETKFKRLLKIEVINIPGEGQVAAKVTAEVQWTHGAGTRDFEIVEYIFEWH